MLFELTIQDFALIDNLKLYFGPGLNVLSGETGAGKSIIVQAIQMVLGARAGTHLVRTGKDEAKIEAYFEYPEDGRVTQKLKDMGIDVEEALIIRRTISGSGKGRVFINGTAATLNMASQLADELISIAGQHEYQALLRPPNHLFLLDAFAGLTDLRVEVQRDYRKWQELGIRYKKLVDQQNARAARKELLTFQLQEIKKANLKIGEDEELVQERSLLASAEKLRELAQQAYNVLYASSGAVTERLAEARVLTRSLAGIDNSITPLLETLDAAFFQAEDVALGLRDYLQKINSDPKRLEAIEERLQELSRLKKKYGGNIQNLLDLSADMEKDLASIAEGKEELIGLEKAVDDAERKLIQQAMDLSAKRKKMALKLAEAVCKELELLHMPGTKFKVDFSPLPEEIKGILSESGIDEVQFLIAPNVGEELKPLARIASGGELSRITLALKSVLTRADGVETTIFDEVDAGIGGAVAEVVGRKLKHLAGHHQVICITHLPQIASFADRHYRVDKVQKGKRTETVVKELRGEERIEEIARMLGGLEVSEKTRAHAREMVERQGR